MSSSMSVSCIAAHHGDCISPPSILFESPSCSSSFVVSPSRRPSTFTRLPSDVLAYIARLFLSDAEACRWSHCETSLRRALRDHRLKEPVPACRWKEKHPGELLRSFGVPQQIIIDITNRADCTLLTKLDSFAPSATVVELACPSDEYMCIPHTSKWRLPPKLLTLRTVRIGIEPSQEEENPASAVDNLDDLYSETEGMQCIYSVPLPPTLTELHLEYWSEFIPWETASQSHPLRPRGLPAEIHPHLEDWLPLADLKNAKHFMWLPILHKLNRRAENGREWTELPEGLLSLKLPSMDCRSPPLHHLPPSLTHLENWNWNRHAPLELPPSLCTVKSLRRRIATRYAHMGQVMPVFPQSVTYLSYGNGGWRAAPDMWSEGLISLDFGTEMRTHMRKVTFPSTIRHLINVPADFVMPLPPLLQSCSLRAKTYQLYLQAENGSEFSFPSTVDTIRFLPGVQHPQALRFPSSLTFLQFRNSWALPIDTLPLPSSLKFLHIGQGPRPPFGFNLPLNLARLTELTELNLGDAWNRSLKDLILPPNLRTLQFGAEFRQEVQKDDIAWPDSLETIIFEDDFMEIFRTWTPPRNLTELHAHSLPIPMEQAEHEEVEEMPVMPKVVELRLRKLEQNLSPAVFPSLKYVFLENSPPSWKGFVLPATVRIFEIGEMSLDNANDLIEHLRVPSSLTELRVHLPLHSAGKSIPHRIRAVMPHVVCVTINSLQ